MKLSAAFSPCPNDTYLICAWATGLLSTSLEMDIHFAPINQLNAWASEEHHPISKISLSHYPSVEKNYILAPIGMAFGEGFGPKVIARHPSSIENFEGCTVAIPGTTTTAHFLCERLLPQNIHKLFCTFDQVIPFVRSGVTDLGLLLHEGQFNLEANRVCILADLGALWQKRFNTPIPLGGIILHRDLTTELMQTITQNFQRSLDYADKHSSSCRSYILAYSQEKEWIVAQRHIKLYIGEQTRHLTTRGISAIQELFIQQGYTSPIDHWLYPFKP